MARGWESKSVEEQQVELASTRSTSALPISQEQLARRQQRQALMLSRQHVIQQIEAARNPRHREMLQNALADLNARLAELE
jgi:hypothetical protein